MDTADIYGTLNEAYFSAEPHEKAVIDHLHLLLEDGMLVVDVGASLGQYTRAIADRMRGGEIVAIEADPLRVPELERNCRAWATRNAICVEHLALTDHIGTIAFHVTNSNVSGSLDRQRPGDEQVDVRCATLDSLCERTPGLVKIDVEGAEARVLAGAQRILSRGKTNFLIELHDFAPPEGSPEKVRALMRDHGYVMVPFFGKPLFTRSRALALRVAARQPRRVLRTTTRTLRRRAAPRAGSPPD